MPEPQCPHGCGRPEHLLPAIGNRLVGLHDCPGGRTTPTPITAKTKAVAERRRAVAALTDEGLPCKDIATRLDIHIRTVIRDRAANRGDGCSYRETARTLGVGRASVMKALPGYGWTYREAGQFRAATRDRAAERRSA